MKYEKLQQKSYLFVYDSLLLSEHFYDTVSLASLRRRTLRVSPTIEANKNTLETFLKLGATFFPVSIYLDSDTHKVAKIPNVKEWQKTTTFSINSKEQLNGHRAYGFHPETIGAYVVDLDNKGVDGEASLLAALGEDCDEVSDPSVYVDTPNGRHLYFSREGLDDILYGRNAVLEGVDIRGAHQGGWLVAPGSIGYSHKREEWQEYIPEGDFSALPRMPDKLHELLRTLLSSPAPAERLPDFISPATARNAPPSVYPDSDPKIAKLFELAGIVCRSPEPFTGLLRRYVPNATYNGRDWLTGDYAGNPGSSCVWSPSNGIIKDFNNPTGKGGDFIWWLHNYGNLSIVESARTVLDIAEFPDPSQGTTLEQVKEEAREHVQGAILAPMNGEYPLTDSGNAERLIAATNGEMLFNIDTMTWMAWNGKRWEKDQSGATIQRLAKQTARGIAESVQDSTDSTKAAKLIKWAVTSESQSRRDSMVKLAQHEDGIAVTEDDFDQDPDVLNTISGIVNLKSGALEAHDKILLSAKMAPYEISYDKPTRFSDFLYEIMDGREDMIDWIHVYLGYSLTGHTNEQLFPIWWGGGANGKSQLLAVVGGIMGDYCKPIASETILQNHSGSPVRDDLAILKGARFVWASEPDAGKALSMSTIKLMTGSDPVTCRHLYGKIFSYLPSFKPVFVTNHRPMVKSQDYGTWRRLRFVPFTYQVPEEKRIPDLAVKLLAEEGNKILGWLIEGAIRWYEEGRLPYCREIDCATDGLRINDDPLAEFLMERIIVDMSLVTPFDAVWKTYNEWAQDKGIKNILSRSLVKALLQDRPGMAITTFAQKTMIKGMAIRAKLE